MWKGSISMSCCDWHMFCFLCFSDDKNAEKIFFMSVILVSCSDLSYSFCQLSVSSFLCFSLSFFSLIVKNNQCLHISVTLLFGTSYSVFSLFLKLAFLHLLVCLWIMDPHSRAPKKNTSHGNEVLLQDTMHLIRRPLLTRKSVPRSSRQSDHTKTSWPLQRGANCSGIVMSSVHQVWPKPSCKAQWKGEEDKADRERGGKITSGNGQALSLPSPRGQWRTGKNGGNWLRNHLWCPNDPCI